MRDDKLHTALWSYHAAAQRRDGVEARLRRGELDEELLGRSLTAAAAMVRARVGLYRLLTSQGWTPPPHIVRDVEYDDALLRAEDELLP